jgi:hypothetical protein
MNAALGTLGFHLDGRACRVGCEFCYLGQREGGGRALDPEVAASVVAVAPAKGIAVAISEPARRWRSGLDAVVTTARARGLPVVITTTPDVVAADPWVVDGASGLTVSVDPAKGEVDVAALRRVLASVRRRQAGLEIVALPSLVTPAFADRLADGLLAELVTTAPEIDLVALNGLKPPPLWCDRKFWLRFLSRIRGLLDQHLWRRLHLDCYVAARILGLGACPAKPDVSAGREFRACVYQAAPSFVFADAEELARRTADYRPPDVCPFPIR